MIWRSVIGIFIGLIISTSVRAQSTTPAGLAITFHPSTAVSFSGPVDNMGTASEFYGLEAMSTAYAASLGTGVVLCTPLDVACETESFAVTGKLSLGAVGSTCTIAGGGTICSIKTFINQANPGVSDETQLTIASRALFVPAAPSNGCPSAAWPCWTVAGAASYSVVISAVGPPFSYAGLAERTGSTSSFGDFIGSSTTTQIFRWRNATNSMGLTCGGAAIPAQTANDNVPHSMQGVCNSTSSIVVVDASAGSTGTTSVGSGTNLSLFSFSASPNPLTGLGIYMGLWPATINSTQYGNQRTQDNSRFGTP